MTRVMTLEVSLPELISGQPSKTKKKKRFFFKNVSANRKYLLNRGNTSEKLPKRDFRSMSIIPKIHQNMFGSS